MEISPTPSCSSSSSTGPSPRHAAAARWRQQRLTVDTNTMRRWKQQARLEITSLLQDRESWHYKGRDAATVRSLKAAYNNHGVRGYTESSQSPKRSAYFGEGVLNVSLEDVAYALYCDDSVDQRTLATNLYQVNFLDGAVLDVHERKTQEDPFRFAGTKWVAYTIPPGLVAHPELIISEYFEYSCKTQDADGHVVLVQYTMCPSLAADGTPKAQANQITTYRYLDEGTHCQTAGWFESSRSVPEWVVTKSLQQIFVNMARLVGLADARAIAELGTASALSTARACYLCSKKFGVLHKRRNCRACGQSICTKCTIKLKVLRHETPVEASEFRLVLVDRPRDSGFQALKSLESKYCAPCVQKSRELRSQSVVISEGSLSLSSEDGYTTTAPCSLDEGFEDVDTVLLGLRDSGARVDSLHRDDRLTRRQHRSSSLLRGRIASIAEPDSSEEARSSENTSHGNQAEEDFDDDDDDLFDEEREHSGHIKRVHSCPPPQEYDGYGWGASPEMAKNHHHSSSTGQLRPRHTPVYHGDDARPLVAHQPQPQPQLRAPRQPDVMAASFNKLAQSIAAQEALLQSLQLERQKFYARHRVPSEVSDIGSSHSSTDAGATAGRFEVV